MVCLASKLGSTVAPTGKDSKTARDVDYVADLSNSVLRDPFQGLRPRRVATQISQIIPVG